MFDDALIFVNEYKTMLGAVAIAVATLIGVVSNIWYWRLSEQRQKFEKYASIAAALASELVDNSHNLIDLYLDIAEAKGKRKKFEQIQSFQTLAYEKILERIGELGSSLAFSIVDVYGDIRKIQTRLDHMDEKEIYENKDEILPIIQKCLAKALTSSIVIQLYSDYLNGARFIKEVKKRRLYWIEKTLDDFYSYASKTDESLDFKAALEDETVEFVRRFSQREDRQTIRDLFITIEAAIYRALHEPSWKAQLIFYALSLRIKFVFYDYLQVDLSLYDRLSDQEMLKYLLPANSKFWEKIRA